MEFLLFSLWFSSGGWLVFLFLKSFVGFLGGGGWFLVGFYSEILFFVFSLWVSCGLFSCLVFFSEVL